MNKLDHSSSKTSFVQGELELVPRIPEYLPNHLLYDGWKYWMCPECDGVNAYGQMSYDAFRNGNHTIPIGLSVRVVNNRVDGKEAAIAIYKCGLCGKRVIIDQALRRRGLHIPIENLIAGGARRIDD